ncbi:MAG: hypothetical protein CMF69_06070 [Magnetovibrio sp.]|nr:hypothetical protein [Magnetovibrio sp.]
MADRQYVSTAREKMKKILLLLIVFLVMVIGAHVSQAENSVSDLAYRALKAGDYKTALRHISFLAVNGDTKAQYNMGVFYRDGIEVDKDDVEALHWFLKAAHGGNILAHYAAGRAFYEGRGSSPDMHAARYHFIEAALSGHATAPLYVGRLFFLGEGVVQNYPRAYFWWDLARDRNAGAANENLASLTKDMSKEDIEEAHELIARCSRMTLRQCLPTLVPNGNAMPL